MKKILYFIAVAAFALSCAKSQVPSEKVIGDSVQIAATTSSTKVALKQQGNAISAVWEDKDVIGVFCSSSQLGNYPYVASIPVASQPSHAEFVAESSNKLFASVAGAEYYAYYPYNGNLLGDAKSMFIEVASTQTQNISKPLQPVKDGELYVSKPYTLPDSVGAKVYFDFKPLLPAVQINLKMAAGTSAFIPISRVVLTAEGDPICGQANLDITDPTCPFDVIAPSNTINFAVSSLYLSEYSASSLYAVTLPGEFTSFELEVVAIDNSSCKVSLPACTFNNGCNYVRDVELSLDQFIQADPFSATAASLECEAGSSVTFNFTGKAAAIDFFSGEKYHDYEYASKDRIEKIKLPTSFWRGLNAGYQPDNTKLMVSTDFNGTMNETNILKATWKDISEHFYLYNVNPDNSDWGNPITGSTSKAWDPTWTITLYDFLMHKSTENDYTEYDIAQEADLNQNLYFAFFWHNAMYDGVDNKGRTQTYITRLAIGEDYFMDKTNITLVLGDNFAGDTKIKSVSSLWQTPNTSKGAPEYDAFRFFCDFQPTDDDRDAYAIISSPIKVAGNNLGPDKPFTVQESGNDTPVSYTYKFEEAGTYKVVIVSYKVSLTGEIVKTPWEFTITVTE